MNWGVFKGHSRVCVAVSGGLDSMSLALLLHQRRLDVTALHIDHRQRGESKEEAAWLGKQLEALGIKFRLGSFDESVVPVGSSHHHLRTHRYKMLQEMALRERCQLVATAHHLRDVQETFMMRFSAASSWGGLASPISERVSLGDSGVQIVRPALRMPPDQLHVEGLPHIDDSSNHDPKYTRTIARAVVSHPHFPTTELDEVMQWLSVLKGRLETSDADVEAVARHRMKKELIAAKGGESRMRESLVTSKLAEKKS